MSEALIKIAVTNDAIWMRTGPFRLIEVSLVDADHAAAASRGCDRRGSVLDCWRGRAKHLVVTAFAAVMT